jgi:hypothetical protein
MYLVVTCFVWFRLYLQLEFYLSGFVELAISHAVVKVIMLTISTDLSTLASHGRYFGYPRDTAFINYTCYFLCQTCCYNLKLAILL